MLYGSAGISTPPRPTTSTSLATTYIGWMTFPYALGTGIFDPAANSIPLPSDLPSTLIQMMKAWRLIASPPNRSMMSADQILNQNIFFNSDILINGSPIGAEFHKLAAAGINRIRHLFSKNGTAVELSELKKNSLNSKTKPKKIK